MHTIPTLENDFVKLSPLTLDNFHHLYEIASQEKLVQYSPSDIEKPEALKRYVEITLEKNTQENMPVVHDTCTLIGKIKSYILVLHGLVGNFKEQGLTVR